MASATRFSYHKLRDGGPLDDEEERAFRRIKNFSGLRGFGINNRRRVKLQIPGLRRFLRKTWFLKRAKFCWGKALKRLKNSQAHMNDLFGGNFLVMQVSHSPTPPFKCGVQRPYPHRLPASRHPLGRFS
ncbi:hypothetical protein P3X46_023452 [Hevea brasiliensis]|uniref:Uncharacterized protein n=1 Tax=Hevea brasiliensis TaxID=3981 RepID=A0ABQ9LAZ2_HEVBR|nr:hypothetical protein P3X46_023452 [Hevea brasiliensis]